MKISADIATLSPFSSKLPTELMSEISPLDLGEPISPMPPNPSIHSANATDLAHKLAVRIASRTFLEVETCINLTGARTLEEYAVQIRSDDGTSAFQRQLSKQFDWEWTSILKLVSKADENF